MFFSDDGGIHYFLRDALKNKKISAGILAFFLCASMAISPLAAEDGQWVLNDGFWVFHSFSGPKQKSDISRGGNGNVSSILSEESGETDIAVETEEEDTSLMADLTDSTESASAIDEDEENETTDVSTGAAGEADEDLSGSSTAEETEAVASTAEESEATGTDEGISKESEAEGMSKGISEESEAAGMSEGNSEESEATGMSEGNSEESEATGMSEGNSEESEAAGMSIGISNESEAAETNASVSGETMVAQAAADAMDNSASVAADGLDEGASVAADTMDKSTSVAADAVDEIASGTSDTMDESASGGTAALGESIADAASGNVSGENVIWETAASGENSVSGAGFTGWKVGADGSRQYYIAGQSMKGWICSDGRWYYLDADGKMLSEQWRGNFYLGADGAALQGGSAPDGTRLSEYGARLRHGRPSQALNPKTARYVEVYKEHPDVQAEFGQPGQIMKEGNGAFQYITFKAMTLFDRETGEILYTGDGCLHMDAVLEKKDGKGIITIKPWDLLEEPYLYADRIFMDPAGFVTYASQGAQK